MQRIALPLTNPFVILLATALLQACGVECPAGTTRVNDCCLDPADFDGGPLVCGNQDAGAEDATVADGAVATDCDSCSETEVCFEDACYTRDFCLSALEVPCDVFGPQYLKASNPDPADYFGSGMAMSGDGMWLAVGALLEDSGSRTNELDNTASDSGAVYVYRRSAAGWSQHAYLKVSNNAPGRGVGHALAMNFDGSLLVLGSHSDSAAVGRGKSDTSAPGAGAALVFRRTQDSWAETAFLKGAEIVARSSFGYSVSLADDGNTLAVLARGLVGGVGAGAVFLFRQSLEGGWRQIQNIPLTTSADYQGEDVSLSRDGTRFVVTLPNTSEAAVYEDVGSTWMKTDTLRDVNNATRVAMSGNGEVVAISNIGERVLVFRRASGGNWREEAQLRATNQGAGDAFGYRVALNHDGTTLAVSSIAESSDGVGLQSDLGNNDAPTSGAVYLFRFASQAWTQHAFIKASNTEEGDVFAESIALSADGTTLAAGAVQESSDGTSPENNSTNASGAAYVYRVAP